jgi:hypothetical protein
MPSKLVKKRAGLKKQAVLQEKKKNLSKKW